MSQVRLGISIGQAETGHQRQTERVRLLRGELEGIVVGCSLRLLHPVQHVPPLRRPAIADEPHASRVNLMQ
jgi:hypothetical protein